ncbi:MAG: hypothetical protein JW776_14920 [Candidatus Lokiarchaeota archaeon]|nr:hypothetical protein [Candidatus Lokiarchaeota archaeon]
MFDHITKLKEKMREKMDIVEIPENGNEVVIVIEEQVENSYTAEVGIGQCWRFPISYDIVGKVFTENSNKFIQNTIKVNTKDKSKSRQILCAVAPSGFIRKIDEAVWDNDFEDVDDLIEMIEHLYD